MATNNLTIAGITYPDVPSVDITKQGGGTAKYVDISDSTVSASDVADGEVFYNSGGSRSIGTGKYASAPVANGNADMTNAILYGIVDGTSTSTAFTATVSGLTQYVDGTTVMLKNGVVTSAAGFTVNINGIGAKPVYSNMAAATADSTIFNVNYTMLFVYDSTRVAGGAWICYRGYNSDTNTIGYQLRTNSSTLPAKSKFYRYRILFTSPDGKSFIPSNTSSSTNATASRNVNQDKIDPFGRIVYYGSTTAVEANANPGVTTLWSQYNLTFGYSFNKTGAALTLTANAPVYLKCAPQTDGSVIIDSTTPYVQALPSTADGKVYIFMGIATAATTVELYIEHPVYEYRDGHVRLWSNAFVPTKTSELTNDSGFITGMTILSYGSSTWQNFIDAYNSNCVVYCRASSNADPGSGAQTRLAFMAYVNANPPTTEVEFQYYRSVSSHSDTQQGDQVFVYKLHKTNGWSVTTREAYSKMVPSTGLTKSYSSGTLTFTVTNPLPSVTSLDNGKFLVVDNGAWAAITVPNANGNSF